MAILLTPAAYAIDPDRAMSQYVHDRWGTEQGFPRGPVYAIAQTPDGDIWMGTRDAGGSELRPGSYVSMDGPFAWFKTSRKLSPSQVFWV